MKSFIITGSAIKIELSLATAVIRGQVLSCAVVFKRFLEGVFKEWYFHLIDACKTAKVVDG
jgi:hypothetical protein